jgi:hypothetical protein
MAIGANLILWFVRRLTFNIAYREPWPTYFVTHEHSLAPSGDVHQIATHRKPNCTCM